MIRNARLAKELLRIIVDEDNGGGGLYRSEIQAVFAEKYPGVEPGREEAVNYHLHILETGGFVKVTPDLDEDFELANFEMTWAGHDLLDAS
ncbi:DUF2513 domain-containing protein [Pseudomonas sp. B21-031]|uniref:DUF2513 domain-containing protein n=1 Tax=Pseudomonas sp. B21-031 TaxID=2895482 RepID=UPI002160EFDE|nr:DUF2513 domain-containing protein [Pseudomonas sp. B21-031]UVL65054.1 DUF2513 domain-containing protein [Pseudomonas sp. B21-031]